MRLPLLPLSEASLLQLLGAEPEAAPDDLLAPARDGDGARGGARGGARASLALGELATACLLYTSPSPRD